MSSALHATTRNWQKFTFIAEHRTCLLTSMVLKNHSTKKKSLPRKYATVAFVHLNAVGPFLTCKTRENTTTYRLHTGSSPSRTTDYSKHYSTYQCRKIASWRQSTWKAWAWILWETEPSSWNLLRFTELMWCSWLTIRVVPGSSRISSRLVIARIYGSVTPAIEHV